MAKCLRCGKGGLFQKVNNECLCALCEIEKGKEIYEKAKEAYEREKESHTVAVAEAQGKLDSLNAQLSDQAELHKNLVEKAQADFIQRHNSQIEAAQKALADVAVKHSDAVAELQKTEKKAQNAVHKVNKLQSLHSAMLKAEKTGSVSALQSSVDSVNEILPTVTEMRFNYLTMKELRKRFSDNKSVIKTVLEKYQGLYSTKANRTIYQLMVLALEAELQNILYNIGFGKLERALQFVRDMADKYRRIVSIEGNHSIAPTCIRFIAEMETLYLEAVKIEYEYYVQKERAKEEQRALREQMRQEAAERKQLEADRKKLEQEESKYLAEMQQNEEALKNATDDEAIERLKDRIRELTEQMQQVGTKKDEILRLQNGKAGHVYIISNLGSFGDNIFKVGMTRRIDPLERVNELGSASVPFPFDVHSFIFSMDAVELENRLHKELHNRRVNKVNLRKEFFNISIDELEKKVFEIQPTAEFNRTLYADQYNQSLSVDVPPEGFDYSEDEDDDENS